MKYIPLTREEERELFRNLTPKNREIIITSNRYYVIKQARKYCKCVWIDINDLIQEGSLGLIDAIGKFDLDRGVRFLTYATFYIRLRILKWVKREMRSRKGYHKREVENKRGKEIDVFSLCKCLNTREKEVIRWRFEEGKTLVETGRVMNISKERVRQLQVISLKRMKEYYDRRDFD